MAIKKKKVQLTSRERRKISIRKRLCGTNERPRVSIFRSSKHTSAQVVSDVDGKILVSASTQEKSFKDQIAKVDTEGLHSKSNSTKGVIAAKAVGMLVAERCKAKKIEQVVFDRNGFLYHGRVRAVAEGLRQGGVLN